MMNGMGWGGMWFGWIFWLVIIGLVIWGLSKIVRNSRNRRDSLPSQEDALDILKKRYAKGEITKEAFEEMKKDLEG